MEKNLIFSQFSIDELKNVISETVRAEMQKNISEPKQQTEFITRHETAEILGISLPTLNEWTKQGIVIGYRIATRVRYKKGEILNSLNQVQTMKYRRGA